MKTNQSAIKKSLSRLLFLAALLPLSTMVQALELPDGAIVNIAELEIFPEHIEDFKRAVIEEMDDSVKVEPGVFAIYAVTDKDQPNKFTFVEIYANQTALEEHRDTPHFKKFVETAKGMINSRTIIQRDVVHLSTK